MTNPSVTMRIRFPHRPVQRLLSATLLLALAPAFAAQAAEWRYLEPQESKAFDPVRIVTGSNGTIWSFDGSSVRRTDAAGNSAVLQRGALIDGVDDTVYSDGVATADGGLVAFNPRCQATRITGELRVTWRLQGTDPVCKGIDVSPGGNSWIGGGATGGDDNLSLYGADAMLLAQRRTGVDRLVAFDALSDGGSLALSRSTVNSDAYLVRRSSSETLAWALTLSGARERSQYLLSTGDGSADVIGINQNSLTVTRIGAQGQQVFSRQLLHSAGAIISAKKSANGVLYVVTGNTPQNGGQAINLVRFNADGSPAWERPLCPGTQGLAAEVSDLVADASGGVANLCPANAASGQARLIRRDNSGTTVEHGLPLAKALQLRAGDDGELLVLGRVSADRPYQTQLLGIRNDGQLRVVPLGGAGERETLQLWAGKVDSDGSSYLLTQNGIDGGTPTVQYLSKIGADGGQRWRKVLPSFDVRSARMNVGNGLVCVTQDTGSAPQPGSAKKQRAFCVRSSDGSPYGLQIDTLPGFDAQIYSRAIENGQVVLVRAAPTEYAIEVLNANGTVRSTVGAGLVRNVGIDNKGRTTLAVGSSVVQYDVDGQQVYRISQSLLTNYSGEFGTRDDGSIYAVGQLPGQSSPIGGLGGGTLWSVTPAGTTRWTVSLPSSGPAQIVPVADAVYVNQFSAGADSFTTQISKHASSDGGRLWWHDSFNRALSARQPRGGRLALSADGNDVVLAHSGVNRLRMERLDASSGRLEQERILSCNGLCAAPHDLRLDAAGTARVVTAVVDDSAGQTAAVQSLGNVLVDPPRIRLDQPGVAGLWYSPYANGEGLAIDWLPASGTLFAAWFTYSAIGSNDPAQLRWYTLQANGVAANATELDLPILETRGGSFNAGPAVSPREVGRAKLRFTDCSNASLSYEITEGQIGRFYGTITLSRLTPSTQNCILADGSSQPGAGARPAAKGFDARMSGAWYDEATVGQGLQLNIQPDGVFFTPWFTYDPADTTGNDRARQHWFTLQGDLAQANNGQVELMLIQTIGGAFDRIPTYNANVVGSASLSMLGCDTARLDYVFVPERIAGPYAARSGRLNLKRMGGCAP
ncbi:hypothetical protein [Tahibacter aquaticus]|nr:hypothetical protein [Tahibacter aquaticus]